jgi:hypothetical protein
VHTWANGDKYDGEMKDGDFCGHGVKTWVGGRAYDGDWEADKCTGRGTITYPGDGASWEGPWRGGEPSAAGAWRFPGGLRVEGAGPTRAERADQTTAPTKWRAAAEKAAHDAAAVGPSIFNAAMGAMAIGAAGGGGAAAAAAPVPAPPPAAAAPAPDLQSVLGAHGLGKYAGALLAEEFDLLTVNDLTDADLEKLGVPMMPRKKMLKLFATPGGAEAAPAPTAAGGGAPAPAPAAGDLDKFIVPGAAIVVGSLADATAGIGSLLLGGGSDQQLHALALEGEAAIEREFMASGTAEDKSNLAKVRAGTYGDGKTLGALMAHDSTTVAGLQPYHVLALRLYTTSSYRSINNPMRTTPPTRPHPFPGTTYFINEGIKKLRHVAAMTPAGQQPRTLWRGVNGLALTADFMAQGGTEFACMSTSANEATAANFAKAGANPMLFKYDTKNCADRGADVAFLSVYEGEAEVLYPPLTFLRFKAVQKEQVGGVEVLVVSVDTQIVGN